MDKYYKIKEIRQHFVCPVDILGCYNIPSVVQDKRLFVLVSLILSAQTKDEVTYQCMLSLCTNLNQVKFVKYKVSTFILQNKDGNILVVDIHRNKERIRNEYTNSNMDGNIDILQYNYLTLENIRNETNLKELIKPAGFYNKKYDTIKRVVEYIINKGYPSTLIECLSIKGLGRKMSILYLNKFYGCVGISVDTHVHRICNVLGIVHTKTPDETSRVLEDIVQKEEMVEFNRILVGYGQILRKVGKNMS